MIKLIAFDSDNVLLDGEAIDEIGKLMGVEKEISALTKKAMEGDLNFETSLKKRVSLLKGASLDDVKKVIANIPLMEGAEETIKVLKQRGYKIATITGNVEIVAQRLKDELNLDYAFYNILHEKDGILTGEVSGPLLVEGSKADILQELLDTEKISAEDCAAVGDGANDISMLKKAGLGVAFNAKPVVKEIADVIIDGKDLRELLTIFSEEVKKEKSSFEIDTKKGFEVLLKEKRGLEKKLNELTQERDKLNEEARTFKHLRDDLNSSIKDNLDKALNYRNERDQVNKEVKKYKKLRDEANQELKKMEWSSGKRDIQRVQDEIKKIDKVIETQVLDIRKENELVKQVSELQKQLKPMKENEETREEAVKLKELSESYHARVVELSDQAQETHEQMIKYFEKIDDIRVKADEAHAEFMKIRENASQKHEEVKTLLKEIKAKNKALDKVKAKKRYKEDEVSHNENAKEKRKEHKKSIVNSLAGKTLNR